MLTNIARLALLLGLASLANGGDYWVDPVSGSNAGMGTSNDPFRTVTHALAQAPPQEFHTYYLLPGIYSESGGEVFPWQQTNPGAAFIGVGDRAEIVVSSTNSADLILATLVRGLTLRDAGVAIQAATVEDCVIHDCAVGISNASFCTPEFQFPDQVIRRSIIHNNTFGILISGGYAAWCDIATVNVTVTDCQVTASTYDGLSMTGAGTGQVRLERCTLARNGKGLGLLAYLEAYYTGSLVDCIVASNNQDFVYGGVCLFNNCLVGSLDTGGSLPGLVVDPNSTYTLGQPDFRNAQAGNFELSYGSLGVDSGSPSAIGTSDVRGRLRNADGDLDLTGNPDLGALESYPLEGPSTVGVSQTLELRLDGPAGELAQLFASPSGLAPFGQVTPFGRLFLPPGGYYRVAIVTTLGSQAVSVPLMLPDTVGLVGSTFAFQALPRSFASPSGAAYTNALEVRVMQ